jgi:hypothetical protein
MRAGAARVVVAAAALGAVSACGSSDYAAPTVVPAGPTTLPSTPLCPDRGGNAGAPVSIEGLEIAAVVLCDPGMESSSPYVEKRYTSGIEPVVAALGRPDEPRPAGSYFCSGAPRILTAQVILVSPDGATSVPRLPVDACGSDTAAVTALANLADLGQPDTQLVLAPAPGVA